jgi:hypothetical protein
VVKAHAHVQKCDASLVRCDSISYRFGIAAAASEDELRSSDPADQAKLHLKIVPEAREGGAHEGLINVAAVEAKNRRVGWRQP